MENWSRIIGLNCSFICAMRSILQLRLHDVLLISSWSLVLASSAAGHSYARGFWNFYSMFKEEGHKPDRMLYKAEPQTTHISRRTS